MITTQHVLVGVPELVAVRPTEAVLRMHLKVPYEHVADVVVDLGLGSSIASLEDAIASAAAQSEHGNVRIDALVIGGALAAVPGAITTAPAHWTSEQFAQALLNE